MPRLRGFNRMCSSNLSDAANMSGHGSTLCSPTVEKILCRSPFRSGHMSVICARLSQKEVGVKRVETLVSTLLPRRGARRIPALRRAQLLAESQRKNSRPSGANTLTQFEYPAQPVQKRSRPERANTPAAVRVPRPAGAEKSCRPSGTNTPAAVRVPRSAGAETKKAAPFSECCSELRMLTRS